MDISSTNSFDSLQVIQKNTAWGNFKFLPNDAIWGIFSFVFSGKEGPTWFGRILQVGKDFHQFFHWTVTPFPGIKEIFTHTHLNAAVKNGCLESVKSLLTLEQIAPKEDENLVQLFLTAIKHGQNDVVEFFLSQEKIKNMRFDSYDKARNPLQVALRSPHTHTVILLWNTRRFSSPLPRDWFFLLSKYGHAPFIGEVLKDPISWNIPLDSNPHSNPLCYLNAALRKNKIETATMLLKSRCILLDPLASDFKKWGTYSLIMLIAAVSHAALAALLVTGIACLVAGVAVGLAKAKIAVLIISATFLAIAIGISVLWGIGLIANHLIVLARAAVLIAYHHFKQGRAYCP